MKIYTRGGDGGHTSLLGGGRVPKAHLRVEAYGAVDELNAALGWCGATVADDEIRRRIERVQKDLFSLGASLATPGAAEDRPRPDGRSIPDDRIPEMEGWIDQATDETPPLRNFIVPGGTSGAASLHLARTICRRAERGVVRLSESEQTDPLIVQYLNRLSDLLFAFARLENHRSGVSDVLWNQDRR